MSRKIITLTYASNLHILNANYLHMDITHDCKQELKEVSLKITPARLGVLEVLENTSQPLDVSSVSVKLEKNRVQADLATVFRIMNAFADKGLVKPIQLNEGKLRYEYAGKVEHHHFICESCGLIEDISDCGVEKLEHQLSKKKGLIIKRHSLEFFGLCQSCQKK
jgi:Fur family transcriptional regulator, ferric uptake regulator